MKKLLFLSIITIIANSIMTYTVFADTNLLPPTQETNTEISLYYTNSSEGECD